MTDTRQDSAQDPEELDPEYHHHGGFPEYGPASPGPAFGRFIAAMRRLQDLAVSSGDGRDARPLYQHVADKVAREWNGNGNCMLVVGATWPEQLRDVRARVGDLPFLVPGVGAQGGDAEAVVRNAKTADGTGLVVSSSRAILYASSGDDYAEAAAAAARELRDTLNRAR